MKSSLLMKALEFNPFGGRVRVYVFGTLIDWNITSNTNSYIFERIGEIAQELGVGTVYAPQPSTFNGRICLHADFTKRIKLGESGAIMICGCDAEGTTIFPREGLWLSSADCPTIITCHPASGHVIAAHAGRDSLIDRGRLIDKPARAHESVVDAIMACYETTSKPSVEAFLVCGIKSAHFEHRWDDPKWGAANKAMCTDVVEKWGRQCCPGPHNLGRLALTEIIRSQLGNYGVSQENIWGDGIDTFSNKDEKGRPRFWSYRRGDNLRRNGVLVVRNW